YEQNDHEGVLDSHLLMELAIARWRVDDWSGARRALSRAMNRGLSAPLAANVGAVLAADSGDFGEAQRLLSVIESNQLGVAGLFAPAYIRCLLDLPGALEALDEAVAKTPEDRDLERALNRSTENGKTWGELLEETARVD